MIKLYIVIEITIIIITNFKPIKCIIVAIDIIIFNFYIDIHIASYTAGKFYKTTYVAMYILT